MHFSLCRENTLISKPADCLIDVVYDKWLFVLRIMCNKQYTPYAQYLIFESVKVGDARSYLSD